MVMVFDHRRWKVHAYSRLLSLQNLPILGVLTSSLMLAVFPVQAQTKEVEVWDLEFTGKGDPRNVGFSSHGLNSSTFNFYDRFSDLDVMPGWMTANGNPGGYFYKAREDRNTKDAGWTAEWRLAIENNGRGLALSFNDDTSLVKVLYDTSTNTVTLEDGLIALNGNSESFSVSVDLGNRVDHTYRLVRKPANPTVELYIDNDPVMVASIQPWSAKGFRNVAAQLKRVTFAHSDLNAAWDFFRYHRGATAPEVEKTSEVLVTDSAGEDHSGYRTYIVAPAINNSAILEGQPLPVTCRDETEMEVLCARGEYEPASFLVQTDAPLEQVMVRVGRLKGKAGVLSKETVDVRVAQKFYRPVTWECTTMPWVLVHDPEMLKVVDKHQEWVLDLRTNYDPVKHAGHTYAEYKAGYSKLNQLNKEMIDSNALQPADIEDFRQFWLTVHVPADAKSGTYRGEVTITAANAAPRTLGMEVTVPSFDLLTPPFEYSAYYPTQLKRPGTTDHDREKSQFSYYRPITEQQYLAECRNMVAHGCMNPCIYGGPEQDEAGNILFTHLYRLLDLREKAGMPKGVTLYLMDGAGMVFKEGALSPQQKQRNIQVARATVVWAKDRGYNGALFMGADEYHGDRLRAMRETYASVRAGDSGIWVAGGADLVDFMSDRVDVPVFAHPGAMAVDRDVQWHVDAVEWLLHPERTPNWNPEILLVPRFQEIVKAAHQNGNRIFTYFDPQGGQPFPEYHRRHRGLGLWKSGLNGTMTWAYTHIRNKTVHPDDPEVRNNGVSLSPNSFVLRGPQSPLDTLSWEGYREGYDDARYLTTLQDAMGKAKAASKHPQLVAQTQRWLDNLSVHTDLDAWRAEMARRTERLSDHH